MKAIFQTEKDTAWDTCNLFDLHVTRAFIYRVQAIHSLSIAVAMLDLSIYIKKNVHRFAMHSIPVIASGTKLSAALP